MQLSQQLRRSQRTSSRLLQANRTGAASSVSDGTTVTDACGEDEACSGMSTKFKVWLLHDQGLSHIPFICIKFFPS